MKRRLMPSVAVAPPSEPAADANTVLQVKVWLVGISPMIWRRVLVPATFTLRELHGVIQVWAIYNVRLQDQIRRQRQLPKFNQKKRTPTAPLF